MIIDFKKIINDFLEKTINVVDKRELNIIHDTNIHKDGMLKYGIVPTDDYFCNLLACSLFIHTKRIYDISYHNKEVKDKIEHFYNSLILKQL